MINSHENQKNVFNLFKNGVKIISSNSVNNDSKKINKNQKALFVFLVTTMGASAISIYDSKNTPSTISFNEELSIYQEMLSQNNDIDKADRYKHYLLEKAETLSDYNKVLKIDKTNQNQQNRETIEKLASGYGLDPDFFENNDELLNQPLPNENVDTGYAVDGESADPNIMMSFK